MLVLRYMQGAVAFRAKRTRMLASSHYSLVVERQPCKLKVLGSIPSGGLIFLVP